jgi:multidrug efflux pump
MMCARLLRHRPDAQRSRFDVAAEHGFNWVIARYDRTLTVVLEHQPLTLLVALATMALTVWLYFIVPKGFFPVQDTGVIQGISVAAQTTSYAAMATHQQDLAAAILKDPDVVSLSSFIGVDGSNTTLNSGRLLINLKPRNERTLNATQITRRLQRETADVPGVSLYMQPVQDLTIDAAVSRTQYQFVLENPALSAFDEWVPKLLARLNQEPSLENIASDLQQQGLTVNLVIDRETAARFGITPATIDNALYDLFGQRIISTIYSQSNQYRVIMEADPALQNSLEALDAIRLPSAASTTGQVPLSSIVSIQQKPGPLEISHLGQFPATTISFDTVAGASLGAAVEAILQAEQDIDLPESFVTAFQGAAAALTASLSNELLLVLAAIVTVYIVLGVLYESFIHPITILSTLPSAGAGALVALLIAGDDIDVISIIGIILLIGIVKKNAIMMIDFALDAERVEGKSPREAIHQACLLRFRPILMTTMAALLGALPLMLGNGTGSELRRPLGVAIVGGLIVSQVLTLYTTPVIYLMFDRLAWRLSGRSVSPGGART